MKDKIFAKEIVNCGRQKELDLAKAVCAFLLTFIHVIIECTPEEGLTSGIPFLFDSVIGGAYSAPMFMFCMGTCMLYTKKNTAKDFAKRGMVLCIMNYVLNIFRYLIPYLIGYGITGDYERYIAILPYKVFGNDIFMFAGLSMLVMALFIKLACADWLILLIAGIGSVIASLISGIDFGNPVVNLILKSFIGTEDAMGTIGYDYPLLHWMLFPVIGYLFGKKLLYVKNKDAFYKNIFVMIGIPSVIIMAYQIEHALGIFGEGQNCFLHMNTLDVFLCCGLNIGLLPIYHLLMKKIPEFLCKVIKNVSSNLNKIYFIHWIWVVIVTELVMPIGFGTTDFPMGSLLFICTIVSVFAIVLAQLWNQFYRKYIGGKKR